MSFLSEKILQKIKSSGPISFESFMEMALYYPELGYYSRPGAVVGRSGDFYTSAHLHKLFGAMLGKQMIEMWIHLGQPKIFNIVEMGAGMGLLAKDMLDYLKAHEIFDRLKYSIVEISPTLRQKQAETLAEYQDKILWFDRIESLHDFEGCLFSNELLDAFPVRLVQMDDGVFKEVMVSEEGGTFRETLAPCDDDTQKYIDRFFLQDGETFHDGYRTEINLGVKEWLETLSRKLLRGFVMTIDYGYPVWDYYSQRRNRGTLLCYHRHRVNEKPYQNIGEQDITAHINFSSLKVWGEALELKTIGFCPQGTYLVSLGLDEAIKEFYGEEPATGLLLNLKALILPEGMGMSHKVMIQYKGERIPPLRGFSFRNEADRL
ncbi:MAG: SAM-dependent methyltransferase [Nitrospirae bacterium]|nr:SAM-dependent methyltransferase [Nitrospirota bacterium]